MIHEGAHALVYGYFGYPVQQFVIGFGAPWASVMVGPTEFGITPFLIGAYVQAPEGVPRIPSMLALLAGPLANIGLLLFHPWSPVRHIHEIVRDTATMGFRHASQQVFVRLDDLVNPRVTEFVTLPDGQTVTILGSSWDVKRAMKQVKKEYNIIDPPKNPFTDESYLDHIPFVGTARFLRASSVWTVSFLIGVANLLPIPPLDGAHILFATIASQHVADTPLTAADTTYLLMSLVGLGFLFVVLPLNSMVNLFRQRRRFAREYPTLVPR